MFGWFRKQTLGDVYRYHDGRDTLAGAILSTGGLG